MPAVRVSHRRRSSLAIGLTPIKPGKYGINSPSPRNVTFAPNVTPGTYVEPDSNFDDSEPSSPTDALFPPSESPAPPPSRRRAPPGKRRSQGYIPRPPNAFMLFRADFVRQKHVPGSIETNHGSLSKIIGNCWRALPLESKRVWENLAKKAKAEHRERYPDYRFRPVHNKNKKLAAAAAKKEKTPFALPDERRCEEVAQLLLEGKKGDELAAAVRQLDMERAHTETASPEPQFGEGAFPSTSHVHMPIPLYAHRRSSSVPPPTMLYNPITIPTLPFLVGPLPTHAGGSRVASPVGNISRSNRALLGQRRASSAQPMPSRSWTDPVSFIGHMGNPEPWQLQRDWSPLPEVDTSLFEPTFLNGGGQDSFTFPSSTVATAQDAVFKNFNFPDFEQAPHTYARQDLSLSISPLDNIPPQGLSATSAGLSPFSALSSAPSPFSATSYPSAQSDPMQMGPLDLGSGWLSQSGPSSAFSESPAPSEVSLPTHAGAAMSTHSDAGLVAPQPQHARMHQQTFDGWAQQMQGEINMPPEQHVHDQTHADAYMGQQTMHDSQQTTPDEHTFALASSLGLHLSSSTEPAMQVDAGAMSFTQYEQGMLSEAYASQGMDDTYGFHDSAVHGF
ncbi:hypothetical protein AcW1_009620 [Taiwanofungus camphoratus]|nr:hypothetical protein AcW1_009620 [Antrodia cinnamomea]